MSTYCVQYYKQVGYKKIKLKTNVRNCFTIDIKETNKLYFITNVSETLDKTLSNLCVNGYLFLVERVFEELNTNILTANYIKRYIIKNYNTGNYDRRESILIAQYFSGYVRFDEEQKRYRIYYKPTHVNLNMQIVKEKELNEFKDEMWKV